MRHLDLRLAVCVATVVLASVALLGCQRADPEVGSTDDASPVVPAPPGAANPPEAVELECPAGTTLITRTFEGTTQVANVHCVRPDGTRHGPFRSFFSDGRPHFEGAFREGERHGEWVEHNSQGVFMRFRYREGRKDGVWQIYAAPGVLQSETEYVEGEEVRATCWNRDGTISSTWTKPGLDTNTREDAAP